MQAESATLIGQAIQQNPAFLTLRKIEVSQDKPTLNVRRDLAEGDSCRCCRGKLFTLCLQAAREIAGTIASANNRVLLNSESLLLNLVGHCRHCFLSIATVCRDTDKVQQWRSMCRRPGVVVCCSCCSSKRISSHVWLQTAGQHRP